VGDLKYCDAAVRSAWFWLPRGGLDVQRRRGGHTLVLRRFGRRVLPDNARTIVGPSLARCGGLVDLSAYSLRLINRRCAVTMYSTLGGTAPWAI
jgi:hypothetical protein